MNTKGRPRGRGNKIMSLNEIILWYSQHCSKKEGDCLLFTGLIGSNGYPKITWKGKVYNLHRLVCEATYGTPPDNGTKRIHAAHSCGNKKCFNPDHLRWATAQDNYMDGINLGRRGKCKLSDDDVKYIRSNAINIRVKDLSAKFSISTRNIYQVIKYNSYRWV